MTFNKYGFINAREIFECPEFVGQKEMVRFRMRKQMDYYSERNEKDGWTTETVLDGLMKDTTVRSDANT